MKMALVDPTGVVVGLTDWDTAKTFTPPEGHVLRPAGDARVGDTWAEGGETARGVNSDNRAALTAKITAALTANRAALEYLGSACPHCKSTLRVGHMGGNTWGIETFHEAACPDAYQNAVEPPEDDSNTQE